MDFHNKYEERTVPEYWWSDNPEIDSWKQIVDYMHEMYPGAMDKALQIAVSVFSQLLTENEIEIILVVFDKRSFQLSVQIVGDIDSYIDSLSSHSTPTMRPMQLYISTKKSISSL